MYKNLKTLAVECLENGNYHMYRKLFPAKQHFSKWIPAPKNCKNQATNRKKSKKINITLKLCTRATNNLIFDLPLTLTPDQLIAENLKSSKQTFDLYHVTIT